MNSNKANEALINSMRIALDSQHAYFTKMANDNATAISENNSAIMDLTQKIGLGMFAPVIDLEGLTIGDLVLTNNDMILGNITLA